MTFWIGVLVGLFGTIALRAGAGIAAERCHRSMERRREASRRQPLGREFERYQHAISARGKEWTN